MLSARLKMGAFFTGTLLALGVIADGQVARRPAPQGAERAGALGSSIWRTTGGQVVFLPHVQTLDSYGLALQTVAQTAKSREFPQVSSVFAIDAGEGHGVVFATRNHAFHALITGNLPTLGEMVLILPDGNAFPIGDFDLQFVYDGVGPTTGAVIETLSTDREAFTLSSGLIQFDADSRRFQWVGIDVTLNDVWAHEVGIPEAGGALIGSFVIEAPAIEDPGYVAPAPSDDPPGEGEDNGGASLLTGPDVIVGDLHDLSRYGTTGGITAYSVGTVSCNIGNFWLNWFSNTNQHPGIAQNRYRLKGGRFEQIGQSWLKHGFFALSETLCFNDCQSTNGSHLGVHCSDPYSAGLNGQQSNLGPRYQVNAATGVFTYPPANPATPPTIGRRLQVHNTDLDPAQNAGAMYWVEGQYVTNDDAFSGNKNNNASYRRVNVGASPHNLSFVGSTVRQMAAIFAWKVTEAGVNIASFDIPGDGHMDLGYKATDLGGGMWHYEYALYNMNSDRSGQSFNVPVPAGVTISNVGFHDVDYHSGEPFSLTDWTSSTAGGFTSWATQTFAQNANSNALRWGTLYNFRFDANYAPRSGNVRVGLFKNGATASMMPASVRPSGPVTVSVTASPNPIVRPGMVSFRIIVTNNTASQQDVVVKLNGYRPSDAALVRNPLHTESLSLAPGGVGQVLVNALVRTSVPAGNYPAEVTIEDLGSNLLDSERIAITVQ